MLGASGLSAKPRVTLMRSGTRRPPEHATVDGHLGYLSAPSTAARRRATRQVLAVAVPAALTVATLGVFLYPVVEDGYPPSFRQAVVYLGVGSLLMVAWLSWMVWLTVMVLRRRVHSGYAILLVAGLFLGGLMIGALRHNAASYVEEASAYEGTGWSTWRTIFPR
jgi:hypothetical protein